MSATVGLSNLAKKYLSRLVDGEVAMGGKNVAQSLARCIPIVEQLLRPGEILALLDLADYLAVNGEWRSAEGAEGQASWGVGGGVRAALISNRGYFTKKPWDEADVILGLLVVCVVRSSESELVSIGSLLDEIGVLSRKLLISKKARDFIRVLLGSPVVPLTWAQVRNAYNGLLQCDVAQAGESLQSKSAPKSLRKFLERCLSEAPRDVSLRPGMGMPGMRVHERVTRSRCVIEGGVLASAESDFSSQHLSDEKPVEAVLRGVGRKDEKLGDSKRRVYVSHQLKLDGVFFQYSNVTLSFPEAKAVVCALRKILDDGGSAEIDRVGALALLFQGVTGRDLKFVANYHVVSGVPETDEEVGRDGEIRVPIPGGASFWKPALHGCDLPSAKVHVELKLPRFLFRALEGEAKGRPDGAIFPSAEKTIQAALNIAKQLRKKVASRFALDRWRGVLPLSVYHESSDPRAAQLICGDRLGMSDAPLYYAAYSNAYIQSVYTKALCHWMPELEPSLVEDSSSSIIGSSLGAASVGQVAELVDLIRPKNTITGASSLPELLAMASDLARWTAWMFAASTGYRNNRSIYTIFRREVDLELGVAVVSDKVGDQAELARPVVLGDICTDQIRALLAVYEFVLSRLPKKHSRRVIGLGPDELHTLREQLHKSLQGNGPLFFPLNGQRRRAKDINQWMMSPLERVRIPANVFRHILASNWFDCGGSAVSLYAQMGHSLSTRQHFGEEAVRSVTDFQKEAQPVIDRLVLMHGWDVLCPKGLTNARAAPRPWTEILRRKSRFEKSIKRISNKRREQRSEVRKEIGHVIDRCLEDWLVQEQGNGMPRPRISNAVRESLVAQTNGLVAEKSIEAAPAEIEELFCKRIRSYVRKGEFLSDPLPVFHRMEREPAKIPPASLSAYALLRQCREQVLDVFSDSQKMETICGANNKFGAAYLRFFVLCVLHLPESAEADVDAYLNALGQPVYFYDHSGCLLEIEPGRCVAVPDWIVLPLVDVLTTNAVRPSKDQIAKWLDSVLRGCPVFSGVALPGVHDLVELVGLSARIELPGLLWPRAPGTPPHKELDFERATALLAGETGVATRAVQKRESSVPPVATPLYGGTSLGAVGSPVRKAVRNALREKEEVDRGVDGNNIGLHRPAERRRTVRDALDDLASVFDDLEREPSRFRFGESASLHFLKALLSEGANYKTNGFLELRTVGQYYGLVREHVMPILSEVQVEVLGHDEWVDVYERAYCRVAASSKTKATNAFFRFHQVISEKLGIEFIAPCDWPWPTERASEGVAFSGVVAAHEHVKILQLFDSWIDQCEADSTSISRDGRLVRAAKILWSLLWNLGLRSASEAMSIRHQDVDLLPSGEVVVCLRRSIVAGLKSAAAHRAISASECMPDRELKEFVEWVSDERRSAGDRLNGQTYVFPDLYLAGESGIRRAIALMSAAVRHITACDYVRPHSGRHSFATNQTFEASGLYVAGWAHAGFRSALTPVGAFRATIGHTAIETTLRTYAHVYQFRHLILVRPDLQDKHVAALLGRHPASLSRTYKNAPVPHARVKHELFFKGIPKPAISSVVSHLELPLEKRSDLSFAALVRLLHLLWNGNPWGLASWRMGLSSGQHRLLVRAILKAGLLLPDLSVTPSATRVVCEKLNVQHPSFHKPLEPDGSSTRQRKLGPLAQICENLERRYHGCPHAYFDDIEMLNRTLMGHHFSVQNGAIKFRDWELMKTFSDFLQAAVAGVAVLKVAVATDVPVSASKIKKIHAFLTNRGMASLSLHNRTTTGSQTAVTDGFGLCLLAGRGNRDDEVAGVILGAVLFILLVSSCFRHEGSREARLNAVANI